MNILEKKVQLILELYKSKKFNKAEKLIKELLLEQPKISFLYNVLGLILNAQNKTEEAISYYKKGIKIDPYNNMIYNNLGTSYKSIKKFDDAETCFEKSIKIKKDVSQTHNNLGNLYLSTNKLEKAINSYKRAIKIDKNFFISYYNLGIAYKTLGRFKESKNFLFESLKLNNQFYPAHRNLSQLIKYNKKNNHFKELKKIYEEFKEDDVSKIEVGFALGKAYEDQKNYQKSFFHYKEANTIMRNNINYSYIDEKNQFDKIKNIFNKELFYKYKNSGISDDSPIFILGMPRSGTTLVEQIISSHHKVYGGDELDILPELINKNINFESKLDKKKLNVIAYDYIKYIKKISMNHKKITDKLPVNFKWIGLIKLALPNSIVIHCSRDSRDNCFSIFKSFFTSNQINYAYNLDEIINYYKLYKNLMEHWKNTLPDFIINIKYEEIINEPNNKIRDLINSCRLEWDDKCIKFYENKRPIKTASDTQARNKIYKTSINSWKRYKNQLTKNFDKDI